MKYANFYDLESLTLLNRHEGCACSIKECDVEKVNRLISRMRQDRERVSLPTAGDVVTYITRGGDYYPQAHIEGAMTGKSIFAFSHRHLSAMKMKSVPVTIRKEALGLQPVRNC